MSPFRVVAGLAAFLFATPLAAQPGVTPTSAKPFTETTMATVERPRAMTFLPDGRFLVTEQGGQVLLFAADAKTRVTLGGVPAFTDVQQGGLRDVVLHPQFARNRMVYLTGVQGQDRQKVLVLVRARFAEDRGPARLEGAQVIFRTSPPMLSDLHFSGRVAFSPNGAFLLLTAGERHRGDPAQDPKSTAGKVLRLRPDGTPAANPLTARGFDPAVWSYGHRNLYGLAFDAAGNLWEHEMGPMGGDEVNLIRPGRNYGWPLASNGSNYDGSDIPDHRAGDGFEPPKVWWNPSISPSGLAIYRGTMFPEWRGDILMGGLGSRSLYRIDLDGTAARKAERWAMEARVREVEEAADGAVWLLYDDGRIVRLARR
jgi:glucose/arabinose dehydrogenase